MLQARYGDALTPAHDPIHGHKSTSSNHQLSAEKPFGNYLGRQPRDLSRLRLRYQGNQQHPTIPVYHLRQPMQNLQSMPALDQLLL